MTFSNVPPLPPLSHVEQPDSSTLQQGLVQQESGGDHRAYNETSYGPSNPALGKLQTLWTTANEVAARHNVEMSASMEEYLNDPRKQDEIGRLLMDEAIQQATDDTPENTPRRLEIIIRKAAMVHYGGPGNMDLWDDDRPQYGGPSGRDYTTKVWTNYNAGDRYDY